MGMEEDFMTVFEVAELLRVNPQTVRNWIDKGSLPAARVGRRVRIRRSDLDRILDTGTDDVDARPHGGHARSELSVYPRPHALAERTGGPCIGPQCPCSFDSDRAARRAALSVRVPDTVGNDRSTEEPCSWCRVTGVK
jgi:excisionase family DNA binding protein